ncbi:MAG: GNAT family N-acetyltransferase [bacterium]|nr:GNAT family N-acetyltransferase [bacterium]
MMDALTLQHGLPEHLRQQAAQIYVDAFRKKLTPIFKTTETAVEILQQDLNGRHAIVALQDDHLLGLTGLHLPDGHFMHIQPRTVMRHLGTLEGGLRYLLMGLLARTTRPGELLMDGIAVHASARGRGIGSKLLNAVIDYARSHHYQRVRLDVVDTNPDAKRLYERIGFVAVKTQHYGALTRWMGFTGSTTMIRQVGVE